MTNNKVYIETYGCQMNTADSEVVLGILRNSGYETSDNIENAGVVLLNTCSIRENAEKKIYNRLNAIKGLKKKNVVIGVLGCMAERLRGDLIDKKKMVDLVVGPDEYRNLPDFLDTAFHGEKGIGVKLSRTETYEDIIPYREEGISAWISIMRGCDNFCTYCVVPYTRGRERSRSADSIINEIRELSKRNFREVTLLGQNVNSYSYEGMDFADLLASCALVDRSIRIRFTTSHPKDFSDKLIYTIAEHPNICKYLHLPVQSGSDRILGLMNRNYSTEHYMEIIEKAKKSIPNVSFSTDIIAGFPTEEPEDHIATLELMNNVKYDGAFMFKYSPREGTKAFKLTDDVSDEIKTKRLTEIIDLQQRISLELNKELIGKEELILVEGFSKKSNKFLSGRTDSNKTAVFPALENIQPGAYVKVKIEKVTSGTLICSVPEILAFHNEKITRTA